MLVEQRVANDGPSAPVAYLLWLFLGFFSAHRFYLGRSKSAVLQFLLNCILIGLIWTFLDLFVIAGMIRSSRDQVRERATRELYEDGRTMRRSPRLIGR